MSGNSEFCIKNGILVKYSGTEEEVTIPEEVQKIGEKAFYENKAVRSVHFSNKIVQIGKSAFQKCAALEEAPLPDSLTTLGYGAFSGCTSLKEIRIPAGVAVLSQNAFSGCESLRCLELPNNLREIREGACKGCLSLTDVSFPDRVELLGRNAFSECRGLKRILLPETIHFLDYGVFGYVSLEELTALGALDGIDHYACREAKVLILPRTDLSKIPTELKHAAMIGFSRWLISRKPVEPEIRKAYLTYLRRQRSRFYEKALEELPLLQVMIQEKLLPETEMDRMLEQAGKQGLAEASAMLLAYQQAVFPQKRSREELCLQSAGEGNAAVPRNRFQKDWRSKKVAGGLCILEYLGSDSVVEVPGVVGKTPVVEIGANAFARRQDLVQVILPDGIRRIGESAFCECPAMVSIHLPDSLREIGAFAFSGCSQLSEVSLPANLEILGRSSFDGCSSLQRVTLPEGIIRLDGGQFRNCSSLENLAFSAQMRELDATAFYGCYHLSGWDIAPDHPYFRADGPFLMTADGKELLRALPNLSGAAVVPSGVETIGPYAFHGSTQLTSVTLPVGLKTVAHSAFSECSRLSDVMFPNTLTEIGAGAFQHCFALERVVLPQGADKIGFHAFEDSVTIVHETPTTTCGRKPAIRSRCPDTNDFVIQNGELRRYLGEDRQVSVPEGVTVVAAGAFGEQFLDHPATKVAEVLLPEGVERIESGAFAECRELRSVTLPDSLRQIQSAAFQNCASLTELTLPVDLGHPVPWFWFQEGGICGGAFDGCKNLKQFQIPPGNRYFTYENSALLREAGTIFVCAPGAEGNYTVPEGVKELGAFAFQNNGGITSITLPNTVCKIGPGAFRGCTNLKEVILSDRLNEIGDHCFEHCSSLRELIVPQAVEHMGDYLFDGCSKLKRVTLRCGEIVFSAHTFQSFWNKNQPFKAEIILEDCSPAKLPEELRDRVIRLFAAQYAEGKDIPAKHQKALLQYIRRQHSKLLPMALKSPDLLEVMLRERMLKPAEKDAVRKQAGRARKQAVIDLLDTYEDW